MASIPGPQDDPLWKDPLNDPNHRHDPVTDPNVTGEPQRREHPDDEDLESNPVHEEGTKPATR